ncbi:MAG: D-alanyl-D-alanine carboxypeptidase/D-alanyl-D-alanine-endopeptidase [Spirochaetes bacterium]|nr:D-alanyl-D-alanine carboxypeptidase/D-alanyl-D-alanine-endopeptidase [Spirochaetota bacterium]
MNKKKLIISILLSIIILSLCPECKLTYSGISFEYSQESEESIGNFARDNYGYIIYDIESEKIVKAHNINREFIPASITKLFTAFFANEVLGNDFTFSTELSYSGRISDNTLSGNLYLTGSGDPELSLDGLLYLVKDLKRTGISEVKGNFYIDETLFPPKEEISHDMSYYAHYNAGIGPLSFNSNTIYVLQRRDNKNKIISADLVPSLPSFESYIYDFDKSYPPIRFNYKDGKSVWLLPNKNVWESRQPLPVKNPGLFTGEVFQYLCNVHGINIPQPKNVGEKYSSKNISKYKSRPLYLINKDMIFYSNNITAELICTAASDNYIKDKTGDAEKLKPMEIFYGKNFTGIDWSNFNIANGSGLTSLNRATPAQTAAVLLFIEKSDKKNFRLEDILPVSGWNGTMMGRLNKPYMLYRVYGKTGSIFYASALAGLFYAKSGKRYIYSVYVDDKSKRKEYDLKADKSDTDQGKANLWSKEAAAAIDEFLFKIIEEL